MRFVDPTGEIWYSVNSNNGIISIINDQENGPDRLYVDADLNGPGLNTRYDYLTVYDQTILQSLTMDRIDSFGDIFHYSISESKEIGNVFLFLSNNSNVEWSLESYNTTSAIQYVLATSNSEENSSTGRNIESNSQFFNENTLLLSIHSHPRIDGTRGASENVGYGNSDMLNIINYANRWYNSHNHTLVGFPKHYIYHKHSRYLYNYTPYESSIFIKKIHSGKDIQNLLK